MYLESSFLLNNWSASHDVAHLVVLGIERLSAGEDLLHVETVHLLRDLVLPLLFLAKQVSVCHLTSWRVTGHLWIL